MSPRSLKVQGTNAAALSQTFQQGVISMAPSCDGFDPQRSRAAIREGTAIHFFLLSFSPSGSPYPPSIHKSVKRKPSSLDTSASGRPYTGGGFFVWDAGRRGQPDLLATLYCTGYESRQKIKHGDIIVAELRLPSVSELPGDSKASLHPWRRLFQTHIAELHISNRGLEACLTGDHVKFSDPMKPGTLSPYRLKRGHGQEIVITTLAMSLLAIEHGGLDSKKWAWLAPHYTHRPRPSGPLRATTFENVPVIPSGGPSQSPQTRRVQSASQSEDTSSHSKDSFSQNDVEDADSFIPRDLARPSLDPFARSPLDIPTQMSRYAAYTAGNNNSDYSVNTTGRQSQKQSSSQFTSPSRTVIPAMRIPSGDSEMSESTNDSSSLSEAGIANVKDGSDGMVLVCPINSIDLEEDGDDADSIIDPAMTQSVQPRKRRLSPVEDGLTPTGIPIAAY